MESALSKRGVKDFKGEEKIVHCTSLRLRVKIPMRKNDPFSKVMREESPHIKGRTVKVLKILPASWS